MLYGSIGLVLFCFWLVLSGNYTIITVPAGILSVLGIVALSRRMGVADEEGHPIHLLPRAVTYWPWLILEIAKSAWDVTKIILHPKLPITPTLIRLRASQRTAVGITAYANSITLTPGTITARVSGNEFLVHALTRSGAEELADGKMDRRVKKFEVGK
ncbi:MAG TPA: cation transporter [Rhizobiales bacterium]|nr:Na(+)/H(+) antiporter subunit E1 [bacterium BMS3Bbin10]HDO51407.1 cation transporter [Hyphomicrobiales bacterium]